MFVGETALSLKYHEYIYFTFLFGCYDLSVYACGTLSTGRIEEGTFPSDKYWLLQNVAKEIKYNVVQDPYKASNFDMEGIMN